MKKVIYSGIRPSLKDIWWNAFMVKDCKEWDENNIPFCRSLRDEIPENLITWKQAKEIFRRRIRKDKNFQCNIYICFYIDDFLFDGKNGISLGAFFYPFDKGLNFLYFGGGCRTDFLMYSATMFLLTTKKTRLHEFFHKLAGSRIFLTGS